jgi:hypothetical protein
MKATVVLAVLAFAMLIAWAAAPDLVASGRMAAAAQHAPRGGEPAWMVISGASLLALASVVRRFAP